MTAAVVQESATVFESLAGACLPVLERYQTDLNTHDRAAIAANPKMPFLHWTRVSGTYLTFLPPATDESFPPRGERVKYLFGTADREHLLNESVTMADYHAKNAPESVVHHFDGKRLRRIDVTKAAAIAREYRRGVLAAWNS